MENMFVTVFTLFFGAVLSAEIGTRHFSGLHLHTSGSPEIRIASRFLFLVVVRMIYFGVAYSILAANPLLDDKVSAFWKPLICAVLSFPIYGIAQLSYRFEPPPLHDPPTQRFPNGPPVQIYLAKHCLPAALSTILPAAGILIWINWWI